MNTIKRLIIDISDIQKEFYDDLKKEITPKINYRSKRIDHLYKDTQLSNKFINYYKIYIKRISDLSDSYIIENLTDEYCQLRLRVRDKETRSLKEKISRHMQSKTEGKIAIQKCINDLLGFRIITDSDYRNNNEFKNICKELKKNKIIYNFYTRSDGDYKAIHLYFKNKSNMYLPWELQIWNKNHVRDNKKSHKIHKKNYLN